MADTGASATDGGSRLSIICIDGDPDVPGIVDACAARRTPGFEPHFSFAASDRDALGLLHSDRRFDIALVNVDGHGTSGMQIFRHLMEPSLRIPRVALTDGREIGRIREAIADGASDFLIKPLVPEDVSHTLLRVMEKVERRRRNWRERAAYSALRREVDIAADMQRRVLPSRFPESTGLDFAATMRPARGIGGDFYDVFAIDADTLAFLVADVSGKGIPAAFYMAIASTALRSVAMTGASPGRAMREVNDFLAARDIPGMFVSVFYAVMDAGSGRLRCANAGHAPPLLHVPGTGPARPLECSGGPVLGILPGQDYADSEHVLPDGGTLVLYTDGVTEAWNSGRDAFGDARLAAAVTDGADGSADAIVRALDAALAAFVGEAEQHDDITALAVRRARAQ